jgi:hypothetical protein
MMVVHKQKEEGEMKNWRELEQAARSHGKVGFLTWCDAQREGVDPDSLLPREQKRADKFRRQIEGYERYVAGTKNGGKQKLEALESKDSGWLLSRREVEKLLYDLVAANESIGMKMPEL